MDFSCDSPFPQVDLPKEKAKLALEAGFRLDGRGTQDTNIGPTGRTRPKLPIYTIAYTKNKQLYWNSGKQNSPGPYGCYIILNSILSRKLVPVTHLGSQSS